MGDIRIVWNTANHCGDWAMDGGDLETGHDLETAILVSLFTHRTASTDYVSPDMVRDPRGWWADFYADARYPIGSRLWQFYRATKTDPTLNDIRDACTEALQWLVDDGVAQSVSVVTQWAGRTGVQIRITVQQGPGPATRYAYVWTMEG